MTQENHTRPHDHALTVDGDATVTLPETTDRNASGAICDHDGRMLPGTNAATIRGM